MYSLFCYLSLSRVRCFVILFCISFSMYLFRYCCLSFAMSFVISLFRALVISFVRYFFRSLVLSFYYAIIPFCLPFSP